MAIQILVYMTKTAKLLILKYIYKKGIAMCIRNTLECKKKYFEIQIQEYNLL